MALSRLKRGFESRWGRQIFLGPFSGLQGLEKHRSCNGSIEPIAVVRDALREKQLLQSLLVVERGLHPQVGGAWQDAFCERQDALYVEFVDGLGVMVDLRKASTPRGACRVDGCRCPRSIDSE